MSDELTPPETSGGEDKARGLVKAAVAAVPGVGGPTAEVIAMLWVDPFSKRVFSFAEEVIAKFEALDFRLDELADDELFVTASARAFAAARQTHEEGKLEALRNAVVNVALGIESDEVWTVVLLDLVDQLTEAHLVTLALLDDVIAGRRARGLTRQGDSQGR